MLSIKNKLIKSILAVVNVFVLLVIVQITSASGPITHFVSAGGPDILGPGGDKGYSLTAKEKDGVVTGHITDRYAAANSGANGDGLEADVDCLSVAGNRAWLSGVVKNGSINGTDISGWYVITTVQDNGTSANDPPDRIGYTYTRNSAPWNCNVHYAGPLFDVPQGQVTVR